MQLAGYAGRDFFEALGYFACRGVAYVSRDCVFFAEDYGDTWFVFLACGSGPDLLRRFAHAVPYPLPYVAWARPLRGRTNVEVREFERVKRLCSSTTAWNASNRATASAVR